MRFKHKGQGVIEYAGALVIAAVLVSAVLLVGPTRINWIWTNVFMFTRVFLENKLLFMG